jgi:choline dehydrogenase-like flavoprotein
MSMAALGAIGSADVVVIGGGSAGAVVAAKLSEDPARRVVLLEAGADTAPGATPDDIENTFPASYFNRGYFWPGLMGALRDNEQPVPFLQPRVMGGGSSVGGMIALRGLPGDYQEWERRGARGWSWRDVLPVFQAMTCDLDDPDRDPRGGPNVVHRIPRERWPLYIERLHQAAAQQGEPIHSNIYDSADDGFFVMPLSQDDKRASSARCYLTAAVRARRNLAVLPQTRALRVVFEGSRASGVIVERNGQTATIGAAQVVVSAGAVNSPALLLRSGIGPAEALRRLDIAVIADRPGVGRNYQNHPQLHFALALRSASMLPADAQHYIIAGLRFSSGVEGCTPGDLFHYYTGRVSHRPFGRRMAMVAAALYAPFSCGAVALRHADPNTPLDVQQRLLSDPRDAERMVIVARRALKLLLSPPVRDCFTELYLMPRRPPLTLINDTGLVGAVKSACASAVLAGPKPVRRGVLSAAIKPGRIVADEAATYAVSDRDIIDAAGAMFHPSSTCAMGAADDPMAVVDAQCRVFGVDGLRVADASVMPRIVSANTNLPTMMIGERVAQFMRAER